MYRGFAQNKNTLFYRAFNAKPRLVAGIGFPLLSTEIICRGGFLPQIYSNFPSQPIQHIFTQLNYNTKSSTSVSSVWTYFFWFFSIFFPIGEYFAPFPHRKKGFTLSVIALFLFLYTLLYILSGTRKGFYGKNPVKITALPRIRHCLYNRR